MIYILNRVIFFLLLIRINTIDCNRDYDNILKNIKSEANQQTQAKSASDVIARIVPDRAKFFEVDINFDLPRNTFRLLKKDSTEAVIITASSGYAACKGFYYYLKNYCNCHISWEGSQLTLPAQLPEVDEKVTSPSYFIYYQNVCTWSYSFAWWKWDDWRKHIDWMALNGISLTLAPVQEMIWTEVYTELGLTTDEIDDHFAGPGFFAWQRMGNLRGWGGPLSSTFKKASSDLQKQVIQALRDLGVAVALPAFAGHVPVAFERIFPNVTMTPVQRWNRFPDKYCCPLFIDPTDPLFKKVGEMFLRKIVKEYGGSNHIYFSDPFNELEPRLAESGYLANASRGIYQTMKEVDDKAVWLLQGWMFVKNPFWNDDLLKSFLTAVPAGKMLVLDLQSEQYPQYERTRSFYGQPFIWCMLHNFGGTTGMHGSIDVVNTKIIEAHKMENSTMYGVGITPEGINQNYVMYEFALERGWDHTPANLEKWFQQYALGRYGQDNDFIKKAWHLLRRSVYSFNGTEAIRGKYIVCRRPSFKLAPTAWYNNSVIENVWGNFLHASSELGQSNLYNHDLVDITRQYFQNKVEDLYTRFIAAFLRNERHASLKLSHQFVEALRDMDRILSSSTDYQIGKWLEAAKEMATTDAERQLFEINARNQITIWGPKGQIVDYAMKQWSGMVNDYCLPRWEMFFTMCDRALEVRKKFNMTEFRIKVLKEIEEPFTVDNKIYPTATTNGAVLVSEQLYAKWTLSDVG
ncbi:alpha-N-acetylglucosaminidase [Bradysia coprophila]|uniref:alpha-N-acetylglucosaminidase n=1 Tax=Bradysia coprophila TaxID=38358 RepID=UPI00187D9F88|nr:alpha-N-acetylglucosaminidase [Bradysia coprophila]